MSKVTNKKDHEVTLRLGEEKIHLGSGQSIDVDLSRVKNLPEVRRDVTIGGDLSEVPSRSSS